MIDRDSKSYPYLAVAQNYGIDYGKVLAFVDYLDAYYPISAPYRDWRYSVWCKYQDEMQRRKQILGI